MPKLWTKTVAAHRSTVRDAILDVTATLLAERGIRAVTMSRIAEATGIGRATLYKYFPDLDAILAAWHERHVTGHLQYLSDVRKQTGTPGERLGAVLESYALIFYKSHEHIIPELYDHLHQSSHVAQARQHLHGIVQQLLTEAAAEGTIRSDVPPDELARFSLHALAAAGRLHSEAAVRRLVAVVQSGLQPPR